MSESWSSRVCCIGAGYVGGTTAPILAQKCSDCRVSVVDIDQERINAWNSPTLPIYEPRLQEIVEEVRGKNLFFTCEHREQEIREAEVIFIAVNTGTKEFGYGAGRAYDLTAWEAVARSIARSADQERLYIIVEKSTVPVCTAEHVRSILYASRKSTKTEFQVISNPEFLAEGSAVLNLTDPDRVLIGGDASTENGRYAIERVSWLYEHWIPKAKILTTNLWSSELAKLAANAFLAQRISSINALSAVCEATGADIDEVAHVVGTDTRVGPKFLKTSVGWGGSCFKKDLNGLIYLCENFHLHEAAEYFRQVIHMNEYQKRRFGERILKHMFGTLRRKKIVVLGFAFKKDTGDIRESPAIDICRFLSEEGASLYIYDPKVLETDIKALFPSCVVVDNDSPSHAIEATKDAHAIVVCTEWDEFKTYDYGQIYEGMKKPAFMFDGRNILDQAALKEIGFHSFAIGKRSLHELH
ncbi:UDP-glucose 6-dehydrogenase [Balamuthia mandrillaris]